MGILLIFLIIIVVIIFSLSKKHSTTTGEIPSKNISYSYEYGGELKEEMLEDIFECFGVVWGFLISSWAENVQSGEIDCFKEIVGEMTAKNIYNAKLSIIMESHIDYVRKIGSMTLKAFDLKVVIRKIENNLLSRSASAEYRGYIQKFAKKYRNDWNESEINKLRDLLIIKGFDVCANDLITLILKENNALEYLDFKKVFSERKLNLFDDYMKVFVMNFGNEINLIEKAKDDDMPFMNYEDFKEVINTVKNHSKKIFFFKKLLNENRIHKLDIFKEYEDFLKITKNIKEKQELRHFEEELEKDIFYSIEDVDSMGGYDFECFLKNLFEKMGYIVKQTKLSGDQGADLILEKKEETTVVQAKRCKNNVGNKAIQEIVASIAHYRSQNGIVVTNSDFTRPAIELAQSNKIELINREELIRLIKEYL